MRFIKAISGFLFVVLFSCCNKTATQVSLETKEEIQNEPITVYDKEFSNQKMALSDFMKWYSGPEYHLNKNYEVAEFMYSLNHRPAECLSYLELRREPYDYNRFQESMKSYENMIYFNFKIEVVNGRNELLKYKLASPQEYDKRIKYISFDMQKDIYAIQNGDTIYPGLYQFERIFDVAPYSNVMLAFDGKQLKRSGAVTIVYNDRLFNNGKIKFNYQKDQLTDLPTVTEL